MNGPVSNVEKPVILLRIVARREKKVQREKKAIVIIALSPDTGLGTVSRNRRTRPMER